MATTTESRETTDQTDQTATAQANIALSFPGGGTNVIIEVSSDKHPAGKLKQLASCGQKVGTRMVLNLLNPQVADIAKQPVPSWAETTENHSDLTELSYGGVELQVCLGNLSTAVLATITDGINLLNAIAAAPEPLLYLTELLDDGDKPLAERVPAGIEPEHWQLFVERFAGICCSDPTCPGSLFLAIESYGNEEDLVETFGFPPEAAQAILACPLVQYIKELYDKEPALGESLGHGSRRRSTSDGRRGPFGDASEFDGVPRPSRGRPQG